jgi:protein-S-isoprenylcysteine O-methyltransferase Ste14
MKQITRWAGREYGFVPRIAATLLAGVLFAFLIPYGLVNLGPRLDFVLSLPQLDLGIASLILGGILVAAGLFYAFWSIGDQLLLARGTPLPVMATQTLLVSGPFRHCRNPMSFGAICLYLGISILAQSISSILIVCLLTALLITYIKKIEERELEARFGQAYLAYKAATPFIIPRPWSAQRR